ncbi:TetR/AcrR family transcriptional regulator [Nocardioides marmoriginsengisoli]|uniref:TetR/AcrR family transcriptional regulator n=1 Tax=Nocardioides marmoriginsengisoli TaxID=661483 RepID=A0A3N0CD90_9ACTN|nr:TetR/AcrR family transcriptional regulator [Nocardioides marmoriginsengisoli]RNL61402.1 TetR/AcrR family transcriptional regulator [Nocardioides marmoriginsengisoli]
MVPPEASSRDLLLAAARDVFTAKGLHAARITDITDGAGVAAGSFYTYFSSKEEIFAAVVRRLRTSALRHVPTEPPTSAAEVEPWIHQTVENWVSALVDNAAQWMAINVAALGDEQVRDTLREQADPFAEALRAAFGTWIENGWIDPGVPCDVAVDAVVAMSEQAVSHWFYLDESKPSVEFAIEQLTHAWIAILRVDVPAPEGEAGDV